MSIERSEDFILAALFLSRCGRKVDAENPLPPAELGTDSWAAAYASFFDALGTGRSLRSFHNSLKATRDQFDSHVDSGRRGWRVGEQPKPLPKRDARVLKQWEARTDAEVWEAVRHLVEVDVAPIPSSVLSDLQAESDEDYEIVNVGIEGNTKAVVSRRRERSPRLRTAALRIHGNKCQVCGFVFEEFYGKWGRNFAEVHHIQELSTAPDEGLDVDPDQDLAVVCSNCHRMIHRKAKRALTLDELRNLIAHAAST